MKIANKVYSIFKNIPNDTKAIRDLKKKFNHKYLSLRYGHFKLRVDSLLAEAAAGVTEATIQFLLNYTKENGRLLNLGGGTGQLSSIFSYLGYDVINTDIAIENSNDRNIVVDLNKQQKLPFDDKSFDAIVCQEVIEHLENPWQLFRLIGKYIKDNGIFVITTPNICSKRSKKEFLRTNYFTWFTPKSHDIHINPIPYWEMALIADRLGFEKINIKGNGDYFCKKEDDENLSKTIGNNEILIFAFRKKLR